MINFSARGAYGRFHSLLGSVGLREKWHEFENEQTRHALRQWCKENGLEINETVDFRRLRHSPE
ncbi:MAG: hypothetical protein GXO75_02620 [Calditrichaeota bacterium]|nr:hypothetical protein [Calditrichota bacterium]